MAPLATAHIIAVGSEMLTPTRVDTNSLAITERLNDLGIAVRAKCVVGDRPDDLADAFRHALARADAIVLTGGLGPTDDDVTREVVAGVLQRRLAEDPVLTSALMARFARRGLDMPAINRRQAMVPEGAVVLPNALGTAPGLWLEDEHRVVVLLPGPPREMLPILDGPVRERLVARGTAGRLYRRVVRIIGRSESHIEEAMQPLYLRWATEQRPLEATILAARGAIDLQLTARTASAEEADALLSAASAEIREAIGDAVYSDCGQSLEEVVGDLLRARGWQIAAAESCTGGLLMKRLTDRPGSSEYVACGAVVYSNASKTVLAGVPVALIAEHGAVSEPVALAMADGIRRRAGAAVGVGITGIAGPGGGTPGKPVGTVVIAVHGPDGAHARTRLLTGGRELIRAMSANLALDMVRRLARGLPIP